MASHNFRFGKFGIFFRENFLAGNKAINSADASATFFLHYSPKQGLLVLHYREVLLLVHLGIDQAIDVVLVPPELKGDLLVIRLRHKATEWTTLSFHSMREKLLTCFSHYLSEIVLLLSANAA